MTELICAAWSMPVARSRPTSTARRRPVQQLREVGEWLVVYPRPACPSVPAAAMPSGSARCPCRSWRPGGGRWRGLAAWRDARALRTGCDGAEAPCSGARAARQWQLASSKRWPSAIDDGRRWMSNIRLAHAPGPDRWAQFAATCWPRTMACCERQIDSGGDPPSRPGRVRSNWPRSPADCSGAGEVGRGGVHAAPLRRSCRSRSGAAGRGRAAHGCGHGGMPASTGAPAELPDCWPAGSSAWPNSRISRSGCTGGQAGDGAGLREKLAEKLSALPPGRQRVGQGGQRCHAPAGLGVRAFRSGCCRLMAAAVWPGAGPSFASAAGWQRSRPWPKVASGGELSRISLAIQVLTAFGQRADLIFDGSMSASVVVLPNRRSPAARTGGERQVLCVTHLPRWRRRPTGSGRSARRRATA